MVVRRQRRPLHPEGISPLVMVEALIADLPSERTFS
jgi:hypothetical protein